jgi:sugar phosphate isomerase/epimerase
MSAEGEGLSRRTFMKSSALGAAALASGCALESSMAKAQIAPSRLRLGGPIFEEYHGPDEWVRALKKLGYNAAYCPVDADEDDDIVKAYENTARKADIIIAEVGVWNNPLDPDDKKRKSAFKQCCRQLDLADRIGAKCCVNVCGSRGEGVINLTDETFDMIVEVVRAIIDEVKPKRSYYALETLPKRFPDSIDSYVRLIKAIDRKGYAAHLDPVNLINNPRRYYWNGDLIRECFAKLGPYIKSCHAKDIRMLPGFPVNLQECQPGLGELDYAIYLKEASKLSPSPSLMLEHLEEAQEYRDAAIYIRSVAKKTGLLFA